MRDYDDIWTDADEYAFELRRRDEAAREAKLARQARIERMRRVAPKGTYVPASLAKARANGRVLPVAK